MSCAYEKLEDDLENLECPTCYGLGEIDDAEEGDIGYHVYRCKACKGTGFKLGRVFALKETA